MQLNMILHEDAKKKNICKDKFTNLRGKNHESKSVSSDFEDLKSHSVLNTGYLHTAKDDS